MFHTTVSETRRRTFLVLLFVCTLMLTVVLSGATGSAERSAKRDSVSGRLASSTSPEMASSARGAPRPSQRGESVPSFFPTSMPGRNLPFAPSTPSASIARAMATPNHSPTRTLQIRPRPVSCQATESSRQTARRWSAVRIWRNHSWRWQMRLCSGRNF
jgi:hypothetical protein